MQLSWRSGTVCAEMTGYDKAVLHYTQITAWDLVWIQMVLLLKDQTTSCGTLFICHDFSSQGLVNKYTCDCMGRNERLFKVVLCLCHWWTHNYMPSRHHSASSLLVAHGMHQMRASTWSRSHQKQQQHEPDLDSHFTMVRDHFAQSRAPIEMQNCDRLISAVTFETQMAIKMIRQSEWM